MNKKNLTIDEIFDLAYQNYQKHNNNLADNLCKNVLKLNPNHFPSIFLLGAVSVREKNYDSAQQLFQKVIKIKPDYVPAYNNLGAVYKEKGELRKAVNCFLKTIQIQPEYANGYYNLGNALKELGEFEKAINFYKKAVTYYQKENQQGKDFANTYCNLGNIEKDLGEFKNAAIYYQKAIEVQPNHVSAYNNLGLVFKDLGEFKKAINSFKKTIEIQPNHTGAHNNIALAYKESGEFQKSTNSYLEALKYEPENLFYYFHLVDLNKEVLDQNLKNKVIKVLASNKSNKMNIAYGNFLLSKYELKEKNYEKEFKHLSDGHRNYFESVSERYKKGADLWLNKLSKVNKLFNFEKIEKNKNTEIDLKPIFIVGVPRCGSTLIEKIIASGIKKIPTGEETGVLTFFFEKEQLFKKKLLNNNDIKNFGKKLLKIYKEKNLAEKKSNYIFTDKSLENFFYIDLIIKIFPQAKIIDCRRNVLSSIMSIFQNNLTGLPWAHNLENIFQYFDNYFKITKNCKSIYPNLIYELEFDNLINYPEVESKKILEFCNIPWSKNCLEFYKRKDIISKTASNVQIRQAIYKHSKERYLPYKKFLDKYGSKYPWYKKI